MKQKQEPRPLAARGSHSLCSAVRTQSFHHTRPSGGAQTFLRPRTPRRSTSRQSVRSKEDPFTTLLTVNRPGKWTSPCFSLCLAYVCYSWSWESGQERGAVRGRYKRKGAWERRQEWAPGGTARWPRRSDCRDLEKECLALAGGGALACSFSRTPSAMLRALCEVLHAA